MKKILSFGEIIWDVYDGKAVIGGAALNFAAHVARCSQESYLFSAIGGDELGNSALTLAEGFGVSTRFIKRDAHETGRCLVTLDGRGVPSYDIVRDVAYDHIDVTDSDIEALRALAPDALYFGTLIQRHPTSRAALKRLCEECSFEEIFCDVNLRRDCYDKQSVEFCLSSATVLKISEEEEPSLRELGAYACEEYSHLSVARAICEKYSQIKHVIITLGDKGCFVYSSATGAYFYRSAKNVRVASTVGAGDSFLAAFAASYLAGESVGESARLGSELSGFVVSRTGAIPAYKIEGGEVKPHAPLLQAHKGVATEYPENTMIAFKAAVEQGYEYIELDPNYTADNKIIVLHDKTLGRVVRNRDGSPLETDVAIAELSYEQALTYDFGIKLAPRFEGERVPLLRDVLCLAASNSVKVKIDNKMEKFPPHARDALFDLISEFEEHVGLTSMYAETLETYAKRFPKAELHYDGVLDEAVLERLAPLGERLIVWVPHYSKLTAWAKVRFADEDLCAMVKKYAKLGVWIIGDDDSFEYVCDNFSPYIVETNGKIKPVPKSTDIYDMHVHSSNSHDSEALVTDSAQSCIQKGIAGFAVTDHFDVEYHDTLDIVGVVDGSVRDSLDAKEKFSESTDVLRGIEIGEGIWHEESVSGILERYSFDVVLGSVHAVRYKDLCMPYSRIDFGKLSIEEIEGYLDAYFDEVIEMIEHMPCDVVSHLTCPLRYINSKFGRGVDIAKYAEKIERVLGLIIDKGLALEVNTSCDDFLMPEKWIIEKYREMGGRIVTLGSDAHVPQNVGKGFESAIETLKECGFDVCYYYKNRIGIGYKM